MHQLPHVTAVGDVREAIRLIFEREPARWSDLHLSHDITEATIVSDQGYEIIVSNLDGTPFTVGHRFQLLARNRRDWMGTGKEEPGRDLGEVYPPTAELENTLATLAGCIQQKFGMRAGTLA